jgi:arylsulfatase A-like enzyme
MPSTIRTLTILLAAAGAAATAAACGKGDTARAESKPSSPPATAPGEPGAGAAPRPTPNRGAENPLFKLDDNRLLAHVQRSGGLVVMPGSGAFAKYAHFGKPKLGWKLKQNVDGQKVGIAEKYVDVDVPLTAEQAQSGKVTLRVKAAQKRILEIKPNGGKAATVQLVEGWQTVSADVPGLRAGENRVQLVSGGKGDPLAFAWIQFGGSAAPDDTPATWDAGQKALVLPEGGGFAYYVVVPKNGRLVGTVLGAGCQVKVRAAAHDGSPVEGALAGAGAVELGALAGKAVRLDLTAAGCKEARLADAALAIPGAAPQVKKDKKPKYVVLWIMDSLRADRTRPYNPKARPEAPNFEKLAQKGAAFMRNYVQGNESRASHASIFSGTWVGTHRYIPGGNDGIPAPMVTIGEIMKASGFFVSGVSANGYITKKHGFIDGFDKYRNHIHDGGGVRGEDVLKFAIESVQDRKDKPFFLYIGTIDTHVSWRAKEPWMSKYDPEPYSGKYKTEASGTDIDAMAKSGKQPSDRDKKRIVAIYDSNVSYQDELLGKFWTLLEQWGIAEDTMLIVTADHGDEQWEEGRVGHGSSLRESLEHVPLLIVAPGLFPGGLVEEGTDTVDILPTIADALGLAPPDTSQGESLIPLAQGVGRGYPRCSIASMYENAWAIRIGDWKARVAGSGVPLVFDIAGDYYEKNDLAESRFVERRLLTDALSTFLLNQKQWKKTEYGSANNMRAKAPADWE